MKVDNPFFSGGNSPVLWNEIPYNPDVHYAFWFFHIQKVRLSNLSPSKYYVYRVRVMYDYAHVSPILKKDEIIDLHIPKRSFMHAVAQCNKDKSYYSLDRDGINDAYIKMSRVNKKKLIIHELKVRDHDSSFD